MSTITGVKRSDKKNVPTNPIRRWLPQSPTRRENTIYKIKAIDWIIASCCPLQRYRVPLIAARKAETE